MSAWRKDEIERAFGRYVDVLAACVQTHDWNPYAELYTEDATFDEHAAGMFQGREAIRAWIVRTMTAFPEDNVVSITPSWHIVDEARGTVVCELKHRLSDPGDGVVRESVTFCVIQYAGDGLWSHETEVYNPTRYLMTAFDWCEAAADHGRLTPSAEEFLRRNGGFR